MRRSVSLVLLGLAFAGCSGPFSWIRFTLNTPLTSADAAFIIAGHTTLVDVVAHLGAPDTLRGEGQGAVALYRYLDLKYFQINYGWPLRFVTVVSLAPHDLVSGGGGLGADALVVVFDSNWVVRYHAFAYRSRDARYKVWPFKRD